MARLASLCTAKPDMLPPGRLPDLGLDIGKCSHTGAPSKHIWCPWSRHRPGTGNGKQGQHGHPRASKDSVSKKRLDLSSESQLPCGQRRPIHIRDTLRERGSPAGGRPRKASPHLTSTHIVLPERDQAGHATCMPSSGLYGKPWSCAVDDGEQQYDAPRLLQTVAQIDGQTGRYLPRGRVEVWGGPLPLPRYQDFHCLRFLSLFWG